jgi:hypothetical protein
MSALAAVVFVHRARRHSSSPCRGKDRWGSAASPLALTVQTHAGRVRRAFTLSERPATPTLTLPLLGGGNERLRQARALPPPAGGEL